MPFKSKAQIQKMRELEKQGKVPAGTVKQWMDETPSLLKLPQRKHPPRKDRKK